MKDEHKTGVMGILNFTPDSFSDGGKYNDLDRALFHAQDMIEQGANVLDIGGESTRPGYARIGAEEEIQRTAPILERLRREFDIPLSIDTYKAQVAEEAIKAGADMVNDIWGLKADPDMGRVIAESGVMCCLMHNRSAAILPEADFMAELKADLRESLRLAKTAGIGSDHIILDPGVGFGKSYEQNLMAIHHLEELHELDCPLLLGTSRKSVIGLTLDLSVEERLEGTLATTVLAVLKGCSFVRVHDVKENVRVIRMTEAIYGSDSDQKS